MTAPAPYDGPIDDPTILPNVLTTAPPVKWLMGRVTSLQLANKSVTVRIRGGDVTRVSYPKGMTIDVGDTVHILSSELIGLLIIAVAELRPSTVPPTPPASSTVAATGAASYRVDPLPETWIAGFPVVQNSVSSGTWFYAAGAFAAYAGAMASLEVQVQMSTTVRGPLAFVLHRNTTATGVFDSTGDVYLVQPDMSVSTLQWIALPLSWASALAAGTAKGVGLASSVYESTVIAGGTLRFTPLL